MAEDGVKMIIEMKEDIASIKTLLSTMAETNDTAKEALQSSKSAHHRLDKIDKIIFWSSTTIIGAVILGLIALLINGGNKL